MHFDQRVFKANDIRGTVPDQLDDAFAFTLGKSLIAALGANRVAIGRDCRTSSSTLHRALATGLCAEGARVDSLGLCPSELLYYAMGRNADYELGVMVTASHNPAAFNGFKVIGPGAVPITQRNGLDEVRELMLASTAPIPADLDDPSEPIVIDKDYLRYTVQVAGGVKANALKIVVDPGNGMGGLLWKWLSRKADIETVRMNFDLDGTFPAHPPDPSKEENLVPLRERVLSEGADLGFAYDGDADRTVVVLADGRIMNGGEMIAALVNVLLGTGRAARFATCMMTARNVLEHFHALGLDPVIVPVGHAKVKRIMHADPSLAFGGEQSGHYYYREFSCCESSLMTTLLVLRMAADGSLARIAARLRRQWVAPPKEASFPFARQERALEASREAAMAGIDMFPGAQEIICEIDWEVARHCRAEDIQRSEAIRVDYADWWFCIRPSATEPLLRLWVEARDRADREAKEAALSKVVSGFLEH